MLYITFVSVGDLPKKAFQEIGQNFKKQLQLFTKMQHIVVNNSEALQKHLETTNFTIVLDEAGKTMTSTEFAHTLNELESNGTHLTIILGGAHGLSDELKKSADLRLSLSPMTTTHDLAHLFFLEQLYRACTINKGKKYHY